MDETRKFQCIGGFQGPEKYLEWHPDGKVYCVMKNGDVEEGYEESYPLKTIERFIKERSWEEINQPNQ